LHEKKKIRFQPIAQLWGARVDGIEGSVQAPPVKRALLAMLSTRVATLPQVTADVISRCLGAWVFPIMFYRPAFALIEDLYCYTEAYGRDKYQLLKLSPSRKKSCSGCSASR